MYSNYLRQRRLKNKFKVRQPKWISQSSTKDEPLSRLGVQSLKGGGYPPHPKSATEYKYKFFSIKLLVVVLYFDRFTSFDFA